ncbi:MAG: D-aminoacylase [Vicinamibacteria bacterium]|nr:D-aminoacylase [Vicinamibacteria bacterium]
MTATTFALAALLATAAAPEPFDVLVRGGLVHDGSGAPARRLDVGIRGDRIAAIGDLANAPAKLTIDAAGQAVAPGFVNVLSWATETLLVDGRAVSDVKQGVTTEIFGEGSSMGPLNEAMKKAMRDGQGDLRYDVAWTSLREYLEHIERRGVAVNVASLVGAGTVREHVVGLVERAATPAELAQMAALVKAEMEQGALGVGSSLIYAPDSYASTEELIALARAAAPFGGRYLSHLRSEGDHFLEAVDELIRIGREGGVGAEIWHLKAAGKDNWGRLEAAIAKVEAARVAGQDVSANMYNYTAGATGFDACVPRWALDGGWDGFHARVADAATRERILREMRTPGMGFENLCLAAGSAERILLVGFRNDALKPLTGRTLASVAAERGLSPEETILVLTKEDGSRIAVVFFLMSEENVARQLALPWVSFGSDAGAPAAEGAFLKSSPHPRAYGNFARLLGRYVRDEKRLTLEEAIRRLTSLPARNFKLADRGELRVGAFADVVVFDPATVADHATFEQPHQYAIGVRHVFVNGVAVLRDGEPTGATPGRALKRAVSR